MTSYDLVVIGSGPGGYVAAVKAAKFGFAKQEVSFEFPKLVARKDQVVKKLQGGIHGLFKANRVDYIEGEASFENGKLMVNGKEIGYQDLLLATGSSPFVPPINGVDQADYLQPILSSNKQNFLNN